MRRKCYYFEFKKMPVTTCLFTDYRWLREGVIARRGERGNYNINCLRKSAIPVIARRGERGNYNHGSQGRPVHRLMLVRRA